jgi:hypothetical protein
MSQTAVLASPLQEAIARSLRGVLLTGRPFGQYSSPHAENFAWCPVNTSHLHIKVFVTYNGPLRENVTKYDVKVDLEFDPASEYLASMDIELLLLSLNLALELSNRFAAHTPFRRIKPGHFQAILRTHSAQVQPETVLTVTT